MSDEEKFDRVLELAGNFKNRKYHFQVFHPSGTPRAYLEVDNVAQKGKTIFIFEGKSGKEERAIYQLLDRYKTFVLHKDNANSPLI